MSQRIAIEPNLTPVKEYLVEKGYQVDSLSTDRDEGKRNSMYDAFIVSGMSTNLLGMSDTDTKAVVINADGLTAEQVYHELQLRLE